MENKKIKNFYIQWHITDRCNLKCKHCYTKDEKSDLKFSELKRGIKNILTPVSNWVDEIEICISGGEPFLSPHLYKIIQYLKKWKKIKKIMFTSNGTIVNLELLEKIKKDIYDIQISLEGGKKLNDYIRGNGAYELIQKNIPVFKALNWKVGINMTIHKLNYEEIPSVVDFCLKNKVDIFSITRFVPCTQDNSINKLLLSKKKIEEIYCSTFKLSQKYKKLIFSFNRTLWNIVNSNIGRSCSAGINGVAILADGTILPCRRLEIPLGNFLNNDFVDIWLNSKIIQDLRNRKNIQKCRSCEKLENCAGCRAIAYAVNKDYLSQDPQCFKI